MVSPCVICRGAVHRWRDKEYVQQSAQADRIPGRVPRLSGLCRLEWETPRPDRRCPPQGGPGGTRLRRWVEEAICHQQQQLKSHLTFHFRSTVTFSTPIVGCAGLQYYLSHIKNTQLMFKCKDKSHLCCEAAAEFQVFSSISQSSQWFIITDVSVKIKDNYKPNQSGVC